MLKILQNSQENAGATFSFFFNKVPGGVYNFVKKETLPPVFSWNFAIFTFLKIW